MLYYSIKPSNPFAHLFTVTLRIPNPDKNGQQLRLPTWIPGSYMIRDFSKNVVELQAYSGGDTVAVTRVDKSVWACAPCEDELTIEYDVYAWDLSVRTAHLDQTHGFFNGTSVFLEVVGQADLPCQVEIIAPEGELYEDWKVATSLKPVEGERYVFGAYEATDYDDLIDHPVEMGDFTLATFEARGVQHDIVLTGKHNADMARLCEDLTVICEHHIDFFGGKAPMDYYVFLTMVVGDGYGGLEHRASTALLCSRDDLPLKGDDSVGKAYGNFLGLCSHEYFHTWNVKRIKPAVFSPFDLSKEQHTRLLWAFEGITSYYDDLALLRSGLISNTQYFAVLCKTITAVYRGEGRFKQSVTDSSFDTWTKFYKQDENAPNAIVSYYTKGALIALCLDVLIRQHTNEAHSLDSLMLWLWNEHGTQGVGETTIEHKVAEWVGKETAEAFFALALYSTHELPLKESLAYLGLELGFRHANNQTDMGNELFVVAQEEKAVLGIRGKKVPSGYQVTHVLDKGAAQFAGLSAGDVLVAIDGLKVSDVEKQVSAFNVGDSVTIHAFRRDELMVFTAELLAAPKTVAQLRISTDLSEETKTRQQHWAKG